MEILFRIKKEYQNENPIFYHIDKVAIDTKEEDMVYVYDIEDGNYFWINKSKLELV